MVSVVQCIFIGVFEPTRAVVAWTMIGYVLALAAAILSAGWAADHFGTK